MQFSFLDHGPLVDGDLELIAPSERWIDDHLISLCHPMCQSDERLASIGRKQLIDFLRLAPDGHQASKVLDEVQVPAYHFWMRLDPRFDPPIPIAGGCNLRIGSSHDLEMYFGHIGYTVYPPVRGRRYAERACRLVLPIARRHGISTLWITCNPDNVASQRTCERLGASYVETVAVPESNMLYKRGEREKCRYRLDL